MKKRISALRHLLGAFAVSAALSLVCFAQQASGTVQPMVKIAPADPIATLVADWTRARDYTKEYLDAMPDAGLSFKPTPDIKSFAVQMLHLADSNFYFGSSARGVAHPFQGKDIEEMDEYKTKAALTKIVMESYDFVINGIKGLDAKKLGETVNFFGKFEATRAVGLNKGFEHQTHHRGQMTIYLRLKGVTPPREKLL